MRISKIQPTYNKTNYRQKALKNKTEQPEKTITTPSFKAKGDGAIIGTGLGVIGGLLAAGGAAIAGVVTLPVLAAGALIAGTAAGGAYLGDKVEDKVSKKDENKDEQKYD